VPPASSTATARQYTPATPAPSQQHGSTAMARLRALAVVKNAVKALGVVRNPQQWLAWKKCMLGQYVPDKHLIAAQIARLNGVVERHTRKTAA
jgi:hypothetical protein